MNRHIRRANDAAVRRTGAPSLALLQDQLQRMAAENNEMRNVLMGVLKEQGRVRLRKATVDSLQEGDSIETRELPDAWVLQFVPSNMVAASGVTDGRPNEPEPQGAA